MGAKYVLYNVKMEKNEEKAQQWEECSQVKFQQESILQVNTAPHQLIDKKGMENVINL